MSNELTEVMQSEQHDCDASVSEEVEEANDDSSSDRMLHLSELLVLLDLLEVQFGQHVEVVGELDDEVQLVKEGHWVDWVICP